MFKREKKIDRETAEQEFNRFCEVWDIDKDVDTFDEEEKQDFDGLKSKIIRAISSGNFILQEDESIEYKLKNPLDSIDKITVRIPKGRAYLRMDKTKEKESIKKLMAFLSDMTGQPIGVLSSLDGRDIKVLISIVTAFFGS